MDDSERISRGQKLRECLMLLYTSLECITKPIHPDFDPEIKMSLLAICEVASGVGDAQLNDKDGSQKWPSFGLWIQSESLDEALMQNKGWCRSELAPLQDDLVSVAGRFFIERLQKPDLQIDHSSCTREACAKLHIEMGTYRPHHTQLSCNCELIGPDPGQIAKCLDGGGFPILKVTIESDEQIGIEAVSYENGQAYVALSHVWADGLGNPESMTLPCCQVARVKILIDQLQGNVYKWGDAAEERKVEGPLFLWCDTLCCPTISDPSDRRQTGLKRMAIDRLKDVYRNAAFVLLLDRTLQTLPHSTMAQLEAAVRISASRWTRRLWTFQEGALARKLLVQFADCAVDFRDIAQANQDLYKEKPWFSHFASQVFWRCRNLRAWFDQAPDTGPSLVLLTEAVRYRGVSVSSDEPLCLAALMGLAVENITASGSELNSRMTAFWKLLCESQSGVPVEVIFTWQPKLQVAGFRWAPRTLIQNSNQFNPLMFVSKKMPKTQPRLTELGLVVQKPGWRIRPGICPIGLRALSTRFRRRYVGSFCNVKAPNGKWLNADLMQKFVEGHERSPLELICQHTAQWQIILSSNDIEYGSYRQALLVVAQSDEHNEQIVHRSTARLHIHEQAAGFQLIHRTAHKIAMVMLTRYLQWLYTAAFILLMEKIEESHRTQQYQRNMTPGNSFMRGLLVRLLKRKVCSLLADLAREADASNELAPVVQGFRQQGFGSVLGQVAMAFTGNYIDVTEDFAEDQLWCVD